MTSTGTQKVNITLNMDTDGNYISTGIKKTETTSNIDIDDNYILRPATLKDAYEIWTVMDTCYQALEHKEYFICDDLDYVQDLLTGQGFAVVACEKSGKIAGNLLVKYPGLTGENLGYDVFISYDKKTSSASSSLFQNHVPLKFSEADVQSLTYNIALTSENLKRVVHMDSASVLPGHRGHGLEYKMIAFAEKLIDASKYGYSFATVAPENIASLKSLEKNGYQVMATKEKYGGMMRCVMLKKLI